MKTLKYNLMPIILLLIGVFVTSVNVSAQNITGSGTNNHIMKFTSTGSTAGNTTTPIFEGASGIGIGTTSPGYKLDVNGDININLASSNANALRIGGNRFLWNNSNANDIFLGVSAGNTTMSGHYNIYIGNSVGTATTTGHYNVGIGENSLLNLTTAYGCATIGFWAGLNHTTGCALVAIGEEAARMSTTGDYNVAVGPFAMHGNTTLDLNVGLGAWSLFSQAYNGASGASYNVALGPYALFYTNPTAQSGGIPTNGNANTAVGAFALDSNTTGHSNTSVGYEAGHLNKTGTYQTAVGYQAGRKSTAGLGTYYGYQAGEENTTGIYNVFLGFNAGWSNSTGISNTHVGYDAGYLATTASQNSTLGLQALGQTTTGGNNTAVGYKAGYANTTGTNNTYLGYQADANANNYTNSGAIGYNTVVTANNKIFMGDVNLVGCYNSTGTWGAYSDARFKVNVKEEVKGLEFIKKLRPVTYNYDTKKLNDFLHPNKQESLNDSLGNSALTNDDDFTESAKRIHAGFIAQEVEQAAKESGFISTIVGAPSNSNDPYTMNYSEIVVPLVKAVQELDAKNRELENQVSALKDQAKLQENNSDRTAIQVALSSKSIVLNQNQPNPFKEQTTITYFIPDDATDVKIIFTDAKGNVLREVEIAQIGSGQLNVFAQDLSSGIYSYTLVADGVTIDSKKMVCTK